MDPELHGYLKTKSKRSLTAVFVRRHKARRQPIIYLGMA